MTGGKKKIKFAEVNFLSLADIFRQKLYRREKTNVKNVFLYKKKHVDFYSCHLLSHIHLSFLFFLLPSFVRTTVDINQEFTKPALKKTLAFKP